MFHLGLISGHFQMPGIPFSTRGTEETIGPMVFFFFTLTTCPSPVIQPLLRDYWHSFVLISLLRRKTHNKNRMLLAVL